MGTDTLTIRDALRSLVTGWRLDTGQRSSVLESLAAPEVRDVVNREAADLLSEAAACARAHHWHPDEVIRQAQRSKGLSKAAREVVAAAVGGATQRGLPLDGDARVRALACVLAAAAFLSDLPAVTLVQTPQSVDDPDQLRMLEKVRALLAKAESTEFEEEAHAFTAKAQELMALYAIDEAVLHRDDDPANPMAAQAVRIAVDEPYATPKAMLLGVIARANRARSVWSGHYGFATVFGSEGDLRAVEMLYTSLLLQAVGAMQRAGSQVNALGRNRTKSFRHAFLLAFGDRIGERLRAANRAAEEAAMHEHGPALLPVLASRAEAAERARDAAFPALGRMRASISNADGYVAGRAAADAASIQRGAQLRSS